MDCNRHNRRSWHRTPRRVSTTLSTHRNADILRSLSILAALEHTVQMTRLAPAKSTAAMHLHRRPYSTLTPKTLMLLPLHADSKYYIVSSALMNPDCCCVVTVLSTTRHAV
jgi:hypothetical protein